MRTSPNYFRHCHHVVKQLCSHKSVTEEPAIWHLDFGNSSMAKIRHVLAQNTDKLGCGTGKMEGG